MAQAGYTPIQLYYSTTASQQPSAGNLANGELALNITDMKLYAKNNSGVVTLLASSSGATGTVSSVAMSVPSFLSVAGSPITSSGTLAVTLSGTALPIANGGTGSTSTTYCSLTTNVTGTLPVANGGSGATTLTGVLKGNGTSAFSAATAGTDYVAPGTATNFTATQTFTGSSSALATVLTDAAEVVTVSATAATGTINYDVTTQAVLYYTSNASGNWTVNFRASSGTSLNTALAVGQAVTVAFLVTNGGTAYYNTAVQIDGSSVTPKWQGGTAPSSGNASSIDVYTYTIIKTAATPTYTVLASQTKFA